VKRFLPEDKHLALDYDLDCLADLIFELDDNLQEDKKLSD